MASTIPMLAKLSTLFIRITFEMSMIFHWVFEVRNHAKLNLHWMLFHIWIGFREGNGRCWMERRFRFERSVCKDREPSRPRSRERWVLSPMRYLRYLTAAGNEKRSLSPVHKLVAVVSERAGKKCHGKLHRNQDRKIIFYHTRLAVIYFRVEFGCDSILVLSPPRIFSGH